MQYVTTERNLDQWQGQSYEMVLIMDEPEPNRLARYTVCIDTSYPAQSRVFVDVWALSGWVTFHKVLGDDPALVKIVSNAKTPGRPDGWTRRECVDMIIAQLLRPCLKALRPPSGMRVG